MNSGHDNMSSVSAVRGFCYNMFVAHDLYTVIPRPGIRYKLGSHLHIISDESPKAGCRKVRNHCHPNFAQAATTNFRWYCNDGFSLSTSTTNLRPDGPDVCFIYFNLSGQLFPSGEHHRTAQFVKPSPRSIVASKTKNPFQSDGTGSIFLTRHKPHSKNPCSKWFVPPMKQSPCSNGRFLFTFSTKERAKPNKDGLSCFPLQLGQIKPLGHRSFPIYSRLAASM